MGVNGWSLVVIRGREIGQSFPLGGLETVLGTNLGAAKGIDLAFQEGVSPRRMAPRQAVIATTDQGLTLRDLDSPGGTFVNRQRLLPGQTRPLCNGDLIQVGAVQLRVVDATAPVDASRDNDSFFFKLVGGTICRSWDDFLRVASQKWSDLRDELVSGRIDVWLTSIGRTDLIMSGQAKTSADERLDAWLGNLPATQPSRAELDVHPNRLVVRVTPGGGTTSRSIQVANVGHRLLRITAKIEPPGTPWIKVADPMSGRIQTVIDAFDLRLEITIPESLKGSMTAMLLIDGNGGSRRVELVLEAKSIAEPIVVATSPSREAGIGLRERIGRVSISTRWIVLGLGGLFLRIVVGLSNGILSADGMRAANPETPGLLGVATVFATVSGLLTGMMTGLRRGAGHFAYGLISGAVAGAGVAAIVIATCRAIEPLLGGWASSPLVVGLLWALIGAGLAGLSTVLVPDRTKTKTKTETMR